MRPTARGYDPAGGAPRRPATDRCAVIAEVAQGHDGSLGLAHSFVDLAADGRRRRHQVPDPHRGSREHTRRAVADQVQLRGRLPVRLLAAHGVHARPVAGPPGALRGQGPRVHQLRLLGRGHRPPPPTSACPRGRSPRARASPFELLRHLGEDGLPILVSTGMSTYGEIERHRHGVPLDGRRTRPAPVHLDVPHPPRAARPQRARRAAAAVRLPRRALRPLGHDLPGPGRGGARRRRARGPPDVLPAACSGPTRPCPSSRPSCAPSSTACGSSSGLRRAPVDKDGVAAELDGMRDLFGKSLVSTRPSRPAPCSPTSTSRPRSPPPGSPPRSGRRSSAARCAAR